MTIGVVLSLLAVALAALLARETRLRRALQALCNRLLGGLADAQARTFPISSAKFRFESAVELAEQAFATEL